MKESKTNVLTSYALTLHIENLDYTSMSQSLRHGIMWSSWDYIFAQRLILDNFFLFDNQMGLKQENSLFYGGIAIK